MKVLKPHFRYNKRQRNGVFYFLVGILLLQGVYVYVSNTSKYTVEDDAELELLREQLDSLKELKVKTRPRFKFNPNYISDEKGYLLGMSVKEIDRLLAYRSSNKWIQNSIHFQEVTQVSDSLMELISPLFQFPHKKKTTKEKRGAKTKVEKLAINATTEKELREINGIGEKLSARILKYQNRLQGFTYMSQLNEVWGLSDEVIAALNSRYYIGQKPDIQQININTASFKEVLSIVYVDYNTTKLLFNYKDSVGKIRDLKEIKKYKDFQLINMTE